MDEISVYIFDDFLNVSFDMFSDVIKLFPKNRLDKINSYKDNQQKLESTISYLLLTKGIINKTNIIKFPEITSDNKPRLLSCENIHFNISHTKCACAAIVANCDVGIDCEYIRPYNDKLAKYICNDEEYELINKSLNKEEMFCIIWTKKESIIKLNGQSISSKMNCIDTFSKKYIIKTINKAEKGYYLSYAVVKK